MESQGRSSFIAQNGNVVAHETAQSSGQMNSDMARNSGQNAQGRVFNFLSGLANERKRYSTPRMRQIITRMKNERTRKLNARRKIQERMRKLTKDLETAECEIEMLDKDIADAEYGMANSTDADEDL